MTPFCLFDSPSIRTGGIGGPPRYCPETNRTNVPRVCLVLPLSVRGQKQGFALPRLSTRGSKGCPLGQVCKAERLAP